MDSTDTRAVRPPVGSDGRSRALPHLARPPVDLRLSLLAESTAVAWRRQMPAAADELSLARVLERARQAGTRTGAFVVDGADVLGRSDVWNLLGQLAQLRGADLGICSAGSGLSREVADRLRAVGVQRVYVPFHSARQDAHDWLVGQNGALKTALRAIRTCVDAGLPVSAEIVLTRPTAAVLAETIEVLARVGVRNACVRRLTAHDVDPVSFVPLSPRLALLQSALERAAAAALERRVRLMLRDLPTCVAPRLRPLFAAPESELWVRGDGSWGPRGSAGVGCSACPGPPQCGGAPRDYVERFGWEELAELPAARRERIEIEPSARPLRADAELSRVGDFRAAVGDHYAVDGDPTSFARDLRQPVVFTWRGPRRVRCASCADAVPDGTTTTEPHESSRLVRARLVQAAQYRPPLLRLVGADLLAHPQSALLIYDAVRLFARVEVAAEASATAEWSDIDLRRLQGLGRIDAALFGPDAETHDAHCGIAGAFSAMQRGIARLCEKTEIQVGAYALVHDATQVAAFAEAWSSGRLPGEPRFRLAARGGSLGEMLDCARTLPAGPARAALLSVLPRCMTEAAGVAAPLPVAASAGGQQRVEFGRSVSYRPCAADPIGEYSACADGAESCRVANCPGMPVGWRN